jgi:glycosyltransferase 2 family protein
VPTPMKTLSTPHAASRIAGVVLMLASFGFIGMLVWSHRQLVVEFRPSIGGVILLALGAAVYGVAGLVLAGAWRFLLCWSGEDGVVWHESRRIYARTQIAKYVPGNVTQLLSRHMVGRQAGWSHVGLVMSSAFEMFSLLSVSSGIAIVGLATTGIQTGLMNVPLLLVLLVCLLGLTWIFVRVAPRLIVGHWPEVSKRVESCQISALWPAALLHSVFFFVSGLVLVLVCEVVLETRIDLGYWPALLSLFAIAWTAGVIAPGAPSGLGIRETVLVAGLTAIVPVAQAVLIAGLLRLLTVSGDLIFFLLVGTPKLRNAPERDSQQA